MAGRVACRRLLLLRPPLRFPTVSSFATSAVSFKEDKDLTLPSAADRSSIKPPKRKPVFHASLWTNLMPSSWDAVVHPYDETKIEPSQLAQLEETCLVVDNRDWVTGRKLKRDCHVREKGGPSKLPLHRGFCLFLFNSRDELLVTQRPDEHVLFPGHYNAACSGHPLYEYWEMEEKEHRGLKKAVIRRAKYELGIDNLELEDLKTLTRLHYAAPSDRLFGEHEISYMVVARKDVTLRLAPPEIRDYHWISADRLEWFVQKCAEREIPIMPVFRYAIDNWLPNWWKNLERLDDFVDDEIHLWNSKRFFNFRAWV